MKKTLIYISIMAGMLILYGLFSPYIWFCLADPCLYTACIYASLTGLLSLLAGIMMIVILVRAQNAHRKLDAEKEIRDNRNEHENEAARFQAAASESRRRYEIQLKITELHMKHLEILHQTLQGEDYRKEAIIISEDIRISIKQLNNNP